MAGWLAGWEVLNAFYNEDVNFSSVVTVFIPAFTVILLLDAIFLKRHNEQRKHT